MFNYKVLFASSIFFSQACLAQNVVMTDVSNSAGFSSLLTLTQSVAWGDFNNDGYQDIFLSNAGGNVLMQNNQDGTFANITESAGITGVSSGSNVGVSVGDLDNDGDLDIYVTHINDGDDQLFRNDGINPETATVSFTDVAASSDVTISRSARGMVFVDYDRDGLLDMYVMASGNSLMYHNLGNLQFEEVSSSIGTQGSDRDVGVVATDLNHDGWPDLFVANRSLEATQLYRNDQGIFTDIAVSSGTDIAGLGMGVVAFDYDNDLDFDLYWTTWPGEGETPQSNVLFENNGNSTFSTSSTSQLEDATGWGISAAIADVNNDGWMDLFVANGFDDSSTPSKFYLNNGDKSFSDISNTLSVIPKDCRGVAFADYDNDGDQDMIITGGSLETPRLYRNDTVSSNHWVDIHLSGSQSNLSAIGTRVEVDTGTQKYVRELRGGEGRGNQSSLNLHFGLGNNDQISKIRVEWPSGQVSVVKPDNIDQVIKIQEAGASPIHFGGSWYNGEGQSGYGYNLESLGEQRYIVYWYAFDQTGNRIWLIMDTQLQNSTLSGQVYQVNGGVFPPDFDQSQISSELWGTLTIEFSGCDQGLASWHPELTGFSEGSSSIQRITQSIGQKCN